MPFIIRWTTLFTMPNRTNVCGAFFFDVFLFDITVTPRGARTYVACFSAVPGARTACETPLTSAPGPARSMTVLSRAWAPQVAPVGARQPTFATLSLLQNKHTNTSAQYSAHSASHSGGPRSPPAVHAHTAQYPRATGEAATRARARGRCLRSTASQPKEGFKRDLTFLAVPQCHSQWPGGGSGAGGTKASSSMVPW
jgi:hypothetical protein